MKNRLLVLAHRQELLDQAAAKFAAVDPTLTVGIERAGQRASGAQIVVASVQTLKGARLAALLPDDFYLIVVDEAHHAVAPSYRRILEHFRVFEAGTRRMLVGFTATPRRGDGQSLGDVFQEIAYSKALEEMIGAGYLTRVAGWRVTTGVSLAHVRMRAGDFVESQLADAVNVTDRNDLVVRAYRELAPGRRCVVFCADVAHAHELAKTFIAAGVCAEAVWGAMPLNERRRVLANFHEARLQVVTNCNLLTEGFDEAAVDCVLMARPTHSVLLYAQMVGRGTRLAEGKKDLLVIDVVDNSGKHKLAGLHQLFELPDSLALKGHDALTIARRLRMIAAQMPWIDLARLRHPDEFDLVAERIDLFRFEPPAEIADVTDFVWLPAAEGGYRLPLPKGDQVTVQPTLLGDFEVHLHGRKAEALGRAETPVAAVRLADRVIEKRDPSLVRLLDRDAGWRDRAPSEKQLELLRKLAIPIPPGLNRGQASWMLAYKR